MQIFNSNYKSMLSRLQLNFKISSKIKHCIAIVLVMIGFFSISAIVNSVHAGTITSAVFADKTQVQEETKTITGVVKDDTDFPLPGVTVMIKGTTVGTITNIDGVYTIDVTSESVLLYSFIGLETQEIVVGNQTVIDVVLESQTELLSEFVVTALGIKKDEKVLGYSMQQVNSDELTKSGNPNVLGALEGKVAGVEVTTSSTGLGGSNKITIRGNSSLAGNNDPLWIVDGIPFNNSSGLNDSKDAGKDASQYGGYDRGGAGVDINPDDIESISVLKGSAAAALYGSLAGNGVIIVTTKRGSNSDLLGVDFSSTVSIDQIYGGLDMQNTYGRGLDGVANNSNNGSWGGKMEGQMLEAWNGETIPYSAQTDRIEEFFNTGITQNYNLGVGKGDKDKNYRFGISYLDTKGVFADQGLKRLNADVSGSTMLNDIFAIDSKVSLSETKTENRIYYGSYGTINQLLLMPRNIRMADLENYSSSERQHINWTGGAPNIDLRNPYYVADQYQNLEVRDRVFGYVRFKADFHELAKLAFKQSLDYYTTDFTSEVKDEGITPHGTEGSSYSEERLKYKQVNTELLLTGQKLIEDYDLDISYIAGANRTHYANSMLYAEAKNLYNGDFNISAGQDVTKMPLMALEEKELQSVFGSAQFYYKSMLNVEITARNDWSSALPADNNSYFYPSVNAGFIASSLLDKLNKKPQWLSFAKLRLSWAQVGKDCDPHQLHNADAYKRRSAIDDNIYIEKYDEIKVNPNLKPEISTTQEVGLDLRFFQNRLGTDITYYNSNTINQIITVRNDDVGFYEKYINAGMISNNGFELALYATPIKTDDFKFDLNLNLAKRHDYVDEIEKGQDNGYQSLGENDMLKLIAKGGENLGMILAKKSYVHDESGNVVVGETTGLPIDGGEKIIGCIQPDFTGSLRTTFAYKNVSLTSLFNFKKGGDIVSVSEAIAAEPGNAKVTENRDDFIYDGVVVDADNNFIKNNDVSISQQTFYNHVGSINGFAEEFLYDASYIKLGEVSLSYNLSSQLLKNTPIAKLKFSVIGRNLLYLYKNTPGTVPDGGFDMFSQAHDFSSMPNTRNIGFSLSATF